MHIIIITIITIVIIITIIIITIIIIITTSSHSRAKASKKSQATNSRARGAFTVGFVGGHSFEDRGEGSVTGALVAAHEPACRES